VLCLCKGSDRRLALWDVHTGLLVRSTATLDREDLIALEADPVFGLVAVGGRDYVSFFDPRQDGIVFSEKSYNRSMGVRSLLFRGNLLSVGGGMGRLSFFDMVAGAWQRFESNRPYRVLARQLLAAAGRQEEYQVEERKGKQPLELNFFFVCKAIYTHNWDLEGARLFVGGGPLLLQEDGAFASLW
jgi:WD repeat-containing protein 40A